MRNNARHVPLASERPLLTKDEAQVIGNSMNDARISFFTTLLPDAAFRCLVLKFLKQYPSQETQWRVLFEEESETRAKEIASTLETKMSASLPDQEDASDWAEEIEQKIFSITLMKRLRRFVEQQIENIPARDRTKNNDLVLMFQRMDDAGYATYQEGETQFIMCNQGLVGTVAGTFCNIPEKLDYDDLFAIGQLGLIRAIEKWDPTLDLRFSTYAMNWIKQAIRKAMCRDDHTIIPSDEVHLARQRIRRFLNGEKRSLTPEEIRQLENSGLSIETIQIALQSPHACSIHTPFGADETGSIESFLASDNEPIDATTAVREQQAYIQGCMALLLPEQSFILSRLHGLGIHLSSERSPLLVGDHSFYHTTLTLETLAVILGKTRERINQIRKAANRNMISFMKQDAHTRWNSSQYNEGDVRHTPLSFVSGMDSASLDRFYLENLFTIDDILHNQSHPYWQKLLHKKTIPSACIGIMRYCKAFQLPLDVEPSIATHHYQQSYQERMLRCASVLTIAQQTHTSISFELRANTSRTQLKRDIVRVRRIIDAKKAKKRKLDCCGSLERSLELYEGLLQGTPIVLPQHNQERHLERPDIL